MSLRRPILNRMLGPLIAVLLSLAWVQIEWLLPDEIVGSESGLGAECPQLVRPDSLSARPFLGSLQVFGTSAAVAGSLAAQRYASWFALQWQSVSVSDSQGGGARVGLASTRVSAFVLEASFHGRYASVKQWLDTLLSDRELHTRSGFPVLERLSLRRIDAASPDLETQVSLSFWAQAPGATSKATGEPSASAASAIAASRP